jgi:pimeloyl-ACP methyl ester carboxylesterase
MMKSKIGRILLWITAVPIGIAAVSGCLLYRSEISPQKLEARYFTGESEYVQVEDARMHIRVKGSGTPVFLIHGSFSSLHTWEPWEDSLSRYFTTVSMDLPGHGLTGPNPSERYSMDDYARLLFALADSLKMKSFYVAGNSMGGGVCWKMALQQPDRVLGMILVDAVGAQRFSGGKKPFIFRLLESPGTAKALSRLTPRFFFRMNMEQVFHDPEKITPELVDRYYFLMRREGNREATVKRLSQKGEDNGDRIGGISCPTLIIWGREDAWIPVKTGEELHRKIQGSELIIFEGAGHVPMEEIPEPTVKEALRFLKQAEALRVQER